MTEQRVFYHFSNRQVDVIEPRQQSHNRQLHTIGKPNGLWISDESQAQSWSGWCKSEEFDSLSDKIKHAVTLHEPDKFLFVSNTEEMVALATTFGITAPWHTESDRRSVWDYLIDWPEVAKAFHGIVITPYQFKCRLDMFWYYSWDCASGCIWNPETVSIEVADNG